MAKFKTCPNGHNYDINLYQCPYCPKANVTATINEAITSAKTVIEKPGEAKTRSFINKTMTKTKPDQKTMITSSAVKAEMKHETAAQNKLAGWLVSFDLDPNGIDFKLFEGRCKIGRSPSNNIILNNSEISDDHVLLLCKEGKVVLQDQLSSNGTFVNNKIIEEKTVLKDNDIIKIGPVSFTIKII